jgi:hypothetical protein
MRTEPTNLTTVVPRRCPYSLPYSQQSGSLSVLVGEMKCIIDHAKDMGCLEPLLFKTRIYDSQYVSGTTGDAVEKRAMVGIQVYIAIIRK